MRTATLLACVLVLPLSACQTLRTERIGVDHYRLKQPYQTREELQAAIAAHESESARLCPAGHVKRKDYDRTDGDRRVLVWEIGCNAQYRPDNSGTRRATD